MIATIKLYDPTGVPLPTSEQIEQAVTALTGKVVGFIDNSKPNFDHLVADLAELLTSRYGVARVLTHRKRAASVPAANELLDDFARQCDLVIAGSGD
jgi:antitoxin component HigA of HigAB toxin-antitoxin module